MDLGIYLKQHSLLITVVLSGKIFAVGANYT